MSEVGRTSCNICIQAYGSVGKETPCDGCRPELKKCNEPYFTLFHYCQDQYIMGSEGPVALDMLAINQAMEDYHVPEDERIEFSIKVRLIANRIFSARTEELHEKMKRNTKAR